MLCSAVRSMFSRVLSNVLFSAKKCLNLKLLPSKCIEINRNLSSGVCIINKNFLQPVENGGNILRSYCYQVMTPTKYDYLRQRTLEEIHRRGPVKPRSRVHPLDHKPYMRGIVIRTLIKHPKKPNSANRKCVLLRLSNGKEKIAFVPGVGHNLQEHSAVLVKHSRTKDVPGLKLCVVRGRLDCAPIVRKPNP